MSDVLITGGTGFLGSHLALGLLRDFNRVLIGKRTNSSLDRLGNHRRFEFTNVDEPLWQKQIQENELVIHCATDYGKSISGKAELVRTNVLFPLEILDAISKSKKAVFINIDTSLPSDVSNYALTKSQFRKLANDYDNVKVIHIQPEYFYGPADSNNKFVTFVIKKMMDGGELNLSGCEQLRDFIHIEDLVEAICKVISKSADLDHGEIIPVGSGEMISLKDLVLKIARLMDFPVQKINFGSIPYRDHEVMRSCADISLIKSMGWNSSVDLNTGLSRTVQEEKLKLLNE